MNAPHIILDNLPSLCQKLSYLVEVWHSYNKNNFACFFETRRILHLGICGLRVLELRAFIVMFIVCYFTST